MVGDIFQPTHLLFVLVVALLVLGPKRLPEVGRTLGTGIRDFRQALSGESPFEHAEPPEPVAVHAPDEAPLRHQPAVAAEPQPAGAPPGLVLTPDPVAAPVAEPAGAAESRSEPGA